MNKFVFEADPPNTTRIPATDILGVTVILLSCSYEGREFVRVGYYVNNEYNDPALNEEPPAKPIIEKIRRNILADKPRVTRFQIKWDSEESAPAEFPPEQPEADNAEEDGLQYGAEELEEEEAELTAEAEAEGAAKADGEDAEMAGVEGATGKEVAEEEEEDDAGSEDLEAESEEDDDEEDLEEEDVEVEGMDAPYPYHVNVLTSRAGETNGDQDMDMGEADGHPHSNGTASSGPPAQQQSHNPDVMVH